MKSTKMNFFDTYKQENPDFGSDTFNCAEETVTKLLATATSSDRPGMLLGKVQSGKTRTFISVLANAFDRGFDIAIVLSKNSKALIDQTCKRLQSEFKTFTENSDCEIYDIMTAPESFTPFELDAKHIFVAKKQTHNIQRLIDLFRDSCPEMSNLRVLIIDDEADNASIGYANKDGEIEATRIASQISDLRSILKTVSFLQVTATPYSLYLQPTEIDVANHTSFEPTRPAFNSLVPVPDAYVGGETYFGEKALGKDPTIERCIHHVVDHNEFGVLKKPDRRRLKLEESLTSPAIYSYRHAIVTFIVGGCFQMLKAQAAGENLRKCRYSFLVHSEAGKIAHAHQENLTTIICDALKDQFHSQEVEKLIQEAYDDISKSVTLAGEPLPNLQDIKDLVHTALHKGYINIVKVNSDEQVANMLDNSGQLKLRTPLNIFIGGQILDRGVTLANLIGFYYGRRPQRSQQDTVLQHSRMYGYRRNELAVTRFYTSNIIRQRMIEMETFDAALRDSIEQGQIHGGDTSVIFIQRSASGNVVPCSPNKILIATTHTLRPFRRILPIGFQSGYKSYIKNTIEELDQELQVMIPFNASTQVEIPLTTAIALLDKIETTLEWDEKEDSCPFDWSAAKASLTHLSAQNPSGSGTVLLWTADNRNSARMASESSHAVFIETPDSEKTEGQIARQHAINLPILFLLRQNGSEEKGWRGTPFYWPVIRAQKNTPTSIYTGETRD